MAERINSGSALADKATIAKTLERMDSNKKKITDKLEQLDQLLYKPEGKAKLAAIRDARKPYVAAFTKASKLLLSSLLPLWRRRPMWMLETRLKND